VHENTAVSVVASDVLLIENDLHCPALDRVRGICDGKLERHTAVIALIFRTSTGIPSIKWPPHPVEGGSSTPVEVLNDANHASELWG